MRLWIIRSWSATDDEPLLCAVVEVALEPPPLRVAGGDEALARGAQLGEPALGLGLQPRVVERDRGRGGDGLHELRIVVERRVVDEHPELAAVALDGRRRHGRRRARAARPAGRCRRCRRARRARGRPGRAADRRAPWRGPPPAARRAACRARAKRSASPPRASRERSRPQSSAAGTVSSAVFRIQTSGITGESTRTLVSQAAYSTPHRLPPTLGSSARRRGREAERQRPPITNATRERRDDQDGPAGASSSALAIPASGTHEQQVVLVLEEQHHRELQDEEADEEQPDEHAVDGRDEPAAGHEAQDQRGEGDDPQLADQRGEREGQRRVDLLEDRAREHAEARDGQQAADRAVGAPPPGDRGRTPRRRRRRACGSRRTPEPAGRGRRAPGSARRSSRRRPPPTAPARTRRRAWEPSGGSARARGRARPDGLRARGYRPSQGIKRSMRRADSNRAPAARAGYGWPPCRATSARTRRTQAGRMGGPRRDRESERVRTP